MRLTSVIHNNSIIQAPIKFDPVSLKVSSIKYTSRVQFSHPHFHSFNSVISNHRRQNFPISCTRGTEQEDGLSPPEAERTSSQTRGDVGKFSTSNSPPSVDKSEEKIKGNHGNYTTSIKTVALCVCTAVAFGIGIGFKDGVGKATEFFAGYILEQSLSVDNLFVFVLVFKYFKVPLMYQNRVLSYGIAGAIIFRLSLILLGTATLQRFEAVNLFLATILLYSSFKLFTTEEDDSDLSDNFIVKTCQRFIPVTCINHFGQATPLLLTVAVIELSDIAFAVDSIPAVFGVTRDPFIVFTSNLFAILGLRSFYTLISEGMAELDYLQFSKLRLKISTLNAGFHISTEASLGVVATSLGAGVILSLMKKSDS
ncbi:unnamed protein product [Dovyalis caffra]|uniref:Integral membrane protein TerC n=1 Tax=Dovyalis caffra TaxID=77055 RepID=A0AAV1S2F2_9ROSI|nr:unnamed protein product [Dovyalis caffra]